MKTMKTAHTVSTVRHGGKKFVIFFYFFYRVFTVATVQSWEPRSFCKYSALSHSGSDDHWKVERGVWWTTRIKIGNQV